MPGIEPRVYHKFVDVDYYNTVSGYVALERSVFPGEWGPAQVGRGPHWLEDGHKALDTVTTFIYGAHRKESWVKVEAKDVPDDWYNKLGYGPARRKKIAWWWTGLGYLTLISIAVTLVWLASAVGSFFSFFSGL